MRVLDKYSFKKLITKGKGLKTLLSSYTAVECMFTFPKGTAYPSIPVYVDDTTTVYPMTGKAYLTGFEIVAAVQQNCKLEFIAGVCIPFKLGGDGPEKNEVEE